MLFSAHPNIHYRTIILSRLLHTSIENILVIDGDIPLLWVSLNQGFNDIFPLSPYNRVIRN